MWGIIAVPYGNRVSVKKCGGNFCQITEKRCQTSVEIEKELWRIADRHGKTQMI